MTTSHMTNVQYVRALYTYIPAKDSPNPEPERELGFTKGDVIKINGDLVSITFVDLLSIFSGYKERRWFLRRRT